MLLSCFRLVIISKASPLSGVIKGTIDDNNLPWVFECETKTASPDVALWPLMAV